MVWSTPSDPTELTVKYANTPNSRWYIGANLPAEMLAQGYIVGTVLNVQDYGYGDILYFFEAYRVGDYQGNDVVFYETGYARVISQVPTIFVTSSIIPDLSVNQLNTSLDIAGYLNVNDDIRITGTGDLYVPNTAFIGTVTAALGITAPTITAAVNVVTPALAVNAIGVVSGSQITAAAPMVGLSGYDAWITGIVTGVTINGVAGVQVDWAYRLTYDRDVDFRILFQFPSAPASLSFVYNVSALGIPLPQTLVGVNAEVSYAKLNTHAYLSGTSRTPVTCRFAGSSGNIIFDGVTAGNTNRFVTAQGMYTVGK